MILLPNLRNLHLYVAVIEKKNHIHIKKNTHKKHLETPLFAIEIGHHLKISLLLKFFL